MFALLGFMLIGSLLGNAITLTLGAAAGQEFAAEYGMLIAYPVMFLPPMIYARHASNRNLLFEEGVALDSRHTGRGGFAATAALCMTATVSLSLVSDGITELLPPMPDSLKAVFQNLTQGNFLLNFLSVSIFAPFFEEWLCRGMILRGLLNHKRPDGTTMSPLAAIAISAVFFALIHMNPWQAIPAFLLGLLFGYVYYRTGSLWLTMLMHFTNNTLSLCLGHIDSLKDAETYLDVMPAWLYAILAASGICFVCWFCLKYLKGITLASAKGNCDTIGVSEAV